MALINWDEALATGHATLDAQHQSMVEIVNRLHLALNQGKGRPELESILVFLRDYTAAHFAIEENLLARHPYPEADQHRRRHADLVGQIGELVSQHQSGAGSLSQSVLRFLEEWLVEHIKVDDQRLALELRNQGAC
jgi:hemerythrin